MKLAIGADHRGVTYKEGIIKALSDYQWDDVGCNDAQRCDFPLFAKKVIEIISNGQAERGILLCGSGIGMSIAANKFKSIYAALVWNVELAKLSRMHNNANILVIPADFVSLEMAIEMVRVWCQTEFLGGRYQERINLIDEFNP